MMSTMQRDQPAAASAPATNWVARGLLVTVGAAALAGDAVSRQIGRLVGRDAPLGASVLDELEMSLAQFRLHERAPDQDLPFWGRMEWLAKQLRLPSHRDVRDLRIELEKLDAAVDRLERR